MNTTTQPITHTVAPIIAKAASESGALAGFETVCYDCGLRMSNTIRTNLEFDVREHIAYFEAKAKASRNRCPHCAIAMRGDLAHRPWCPFAEDRRS
jgi:hypothetical protein